MKIGTEEKCAAIPSKYTYIIETLNKWDSFMPYRRQMYDITEEQ